MRSLKDQKTAFPPRQMTPADLKRRANMRSLGVPIIVCHTGKDGPAPNLPPEWGTWSFQCEHCKRAHQHGAGEGLRSSHCASPNSPLFGHDYYLVHHSQTEPAQLRD